MQTLVAPVALVYTVPLALFFEGPRLVAWYEQVKGPLYPIAMSCFAAFGLNLSVFWTLKVTSGVTLSVAGNLKAAFVIAASYVIFKNPISTGAVLGCAITIVGCLLYGLLKD